jgi:hypothetical protein
MPSVLVMTAEGTHRRELRVAVTLLRTFDDTVDGMVGNP